MISPWRTNQPPQLSFWKMIRGKNHGFQYNTRTIRGEHLQSVFPNKKHNKINLLKKTNVKEYTFFITRQWCIALSATLFADGSNYCLWPRGLPINVTGAANFVARLKVTPSNCSQPTDSFVMPVSVSHPRSMWQDGHFARHVWVTDQE